MNESAKKQFAAASVSYDMYETILFFTQTIDKISDARQSPGDARLAEKSKAAQIQFDNRLGPQIDEMSRFGCDKVALEKLRNNAIKIFRLWETKDQSQDIAATNKLNLAIAKFLASFYTQTSKQLRHVQILASQEKESAILSLDPLLLLQLAAAVTLIYTLALARYLDKSIGRPLSLLSDACLLIAQRSEIEIKDRQSSEIGALQSSFQHMSEQVLENEKRRKSYLLLLQSIQLKSLDHCASSIKSLLELEGLGERIKGKLERTLPALASLRALLASMTEQLQTEVGQELKLSPSLCSSKELAAQVCQSLESYAQNQSVQIAVESGEYEFIADRQLIERVLSNLISNAIKYSPPGSELRLAISEETNNSLLFSVRDHGPGISQSDQRLLFQRFSQVEAEDGLKRSGTGLGLAICKDIIEAHQGQIGCNSEVGKGSKFWFSLPKEFASNDKISAANKASERALENKRHLVRSIKSRFAFLLFLFSAAQAALFITMYGLFSESSQSSSFYAKQKASLLESENNYMSFVRWENGLQRAAISRDLTAFATCPQDLEKEIARVVKVLKRKGENNKTIAIHNEILKGEKNVLALLKYSRDHIDEVLADTEQARLQTTKLLQKVEKSWAKLLANLAADFQSSYDFTVEIRNKILTLIMIAAAADALLIASALYFSLKLVGRILILRSKAETFAAGNRITPSLAGDDELQFLDQRLCRVANEIRESEARRQELLAVISHDLRTPLAAVLVTMETVCQGVYGELSETQSIPARAAKEAVEKLLNQINDLLLLEKLESGTYKPQTSDQILTQLLNNVLSDCDNLLKKKKLAAELRLPLELTSQKASVDKALFEKVLSIIFRNAIEASDPGQGICIELSRKDKRLILSFFNGGAIIEPALAEQIFQRFRFINGQALSGFGLPLAHKSCLIMNAELSYRPGENGRTCFELAIPAASDFESDSESQTTSVSPSGSESASASESASESKSV